jgi:hypothetical protein
LHEVFADRFDLFWQTVVETEGIGMGETALRLLLPSL